MGRPINNIRKSNGIIKINKQGARQLITLLRCIVVRMTGNANFTTPVPALTVATSAANDLATAFENQSIKRARGSKNDTADFNAKLIAARSVATSLLNYVKNTAVIAAAGDNSVYNSVITSSGFGVIPAKRRAKVQQIPTFVRQTNNKLFPSNTGRINWKRPIGDIKGAKIAGYNIYTMVGGNWTIFATTTKTNYIVPVTPGVNTDVRIVPFNSRGSGQPFFTTVKGLQ
jgi:hypothetical protein